MYRRFTKFASDEAGLTTIEFSLIGAIVSVAAIAAAVSFGDTAVVGYVAAAADWCLALLS